MSEKVLITGANGGFGRLTTLSAHVVELDVTDDDSVEAAVANAVGLVGGLDVVINNAGVGSIGLLETFTPADWQAVFDINVFGVQRVSRAALPLMRAQGSGLLVVVSSVVGRMALPFFGTFEAFEGAMASGPAQDPQNVADAIVALVDTPAGERRFRTVVDSMGMADAITPHNEVSEQVTAAVYGAFGMSDLLGVNTGTR